MTQRKTSFVVELPGPEAADLALRAAKEGVSTLLLLQYLVIRSAFGILHPMVIEFESRDRLGQAGPRRDAKEC